MIDRRRFNVLLAAGSALAASGAWGQTAAVPKSGGELIVAFDGAAVVTFVLDPHNSGFAPHVRVHHSIFDSLVVLLPDQTVGPWLAKSWEISPDRLSYTFKLRTDVKFHDGTPFNAEAVKANFDRLVDPKNALVNAPDLGPYAGSDVLADDTVRIRLSASFTPLLHNLSKTTVAIISPAALAKYGSNISQNPVGTGPFRFVSLIQGTEIRLAKNPDYQWAPTTAAHQGPAYVDLLTFKNVPEESTRVAALQSRQIHAADSIPPQNVAAFKSDPSFRWIEKELLNDNYSLYLNVDKEPWSDDDVRKAVQLSLDLDTVVRVIYLGSQPRAWSPLSPSMFASHDKDLANSWKHDPAKAAQLLEAKGWKRGSDGIREKDGKRLAISFIDTQGNREKRLDVIQFVRRQLISNGIALNIDSQPAGTYTQKISDDEFDLTGSSQFASDPDVLRRQFLPQGRAASSGIKVHDPEISQWLADSVHQEDAERLATYLNVERKLVEKAYAIPVYVLLYNIAATTAVNGIRIDTHGFPEFNDAWLSA